MTDEELIEKYEEAIAAAKKAGDKQKAAQLQELMEEFKVIAGIS